MNRKTGEREKESQEIIQENVKEGDRKTCRKTEERT
jgi:hypothetical protein